MECWVAFVVFRRKKGCGLYEFAGMLCWLKRQRERRGGEGRERGGGGQGEGRGLKLLLSFFFQPALSRLESFLPHVSGSHSDKTKDLVGQAVFV